MNASKADLVNKTWRDRLPKPKAKAPKRPPATSTVTAVVPIEVKEWIKGICAERGALSESKVIGEMLIDEFRRDTLSFAKEALDEDYRLELSRAGAVQPK